MKGCIKIFFKQHRVENTGAFETMLQELEAQLPRLRKNQRLPEWAPKSGALVTSDLERMYQGPSAKRH